MTASILYCRLFISLLSYIYLQVIYRIKLPGPVICGEGKPENQNHAIIFTRGEGLQTIDMNQVPQENISCVCVYVSMCVRIYLGQK